MVFCVTLKYSKLRVRLQILCATSTYREREKESDRQTKKESDRHTGAQQKISEEKKTEKDHLDKEVALKSQPNKSNVETKYKNVE